MRIGVLTSSRADYSIYLPLLKELKKEQKLKFKILAFGTHTLSQFGATINNIKSDGFTDIIKVDAAPLGDSPEDLANAMGNTLSKFATVFVENSFDLLFALGDRYEMFAACSAAVPFGFPIAHIHGGETTTGAIDDAFRHSITHMSAYHFTAAEAYRKRVVQLKGSENQVYNTGSLSIDNLKTLKLLSPADFKERFHIDLALPTILITFHPETVVFEQNETYVAELISALESFDEFQLVITMPNADTMGNMVRKRLQEFIAGHKNAIGIESFGTIGYLTCMKYCTMMLGNTSSGFIEASFFPKYVINLGERQTGRILTPNIKNTAISRSAIIEAVRSFDPALLPSKIDLYGDGCAAERIVSVIKSIAD